MGLFSGFSKNSGTVEARKLNTDYAQLLVDGEIIEVGFLVIRDTFIFTNKRLILVNVQGMSGKSTEFLFIPYNRITKFSIETGNNFELDAEFKVWVGSDAVPISKKFNATVNIYDLQKVLASYVLKMNQ